MKVPRQEARLMVYGDHEDWETVDGPNIIGRSRWSLHFQGIFKHIPTQVLYRFVWQDGATEYQSERPFEDNDPEGVEVRAMEVITTVYVALTDQRFLLASQPTIK